MKNIIRRILREHNQEIIDRILDKINDVGYENLSDYEKSLLGKLSSGDSKFTSIEDDAIDLLKATYGKFNYEGFVEKTYGGRFTEKGYVFSNDDLELMMKLVISVNGGIRNTLYISTEIISTMDKFDFSDKELNDVIIKWLNETYPKFDFNKFKIRLLF